MAFRGTILVGLLTALLIVALPARAFADPPSFEEQGSVVDTFENSVGEIVFLRRGWWGGPVDDRGFGFTKAFVKHNIKNNNVIRKAVREPARVEHLYGGTWKHERDVGLYEDGRLAEVRTVRVLINYWGWGGVGQQGVVTVYCLNPDKSWPCPEWINEAP